MLIDVLVLGLVVLTESNLGLMMDLRWFINIVFFDALNDGKPVGSFIE